jgi:hypothetical protein
MVTPRTYSAVVVGGLSRIGSVGGNAPIESWIGSMVGG